MEKHCQYSDSQLMLAMENAALDPGVFTHEAHLRWGWLLLEACGLEVAVERACSQLKQYTAQLGVEDKYNETITIAAIRAIQHFRLKNKNESFYEFIDRAARLKTSFKELMSAHYSEDIFRSKKAKQKYLKPDLLPFA
ncbi:MAG: hypothetical protein ACR2MM_12760 [Flavobacteriaceae bacterium]